MNSSEKYNQRRELRQRIRDAGRLCPDGIVRKIAKFIEVDTKLRTVAMFSALPGEVNLAALVSLSEQKKPVKWVFPKVVNDDLKFFRIHDLETDLESGAFGIMEPREGLEEVEVDQIDLFLCPGLGFDVSGGRVGRGKGFYDRMLSNARPDAMKLGVCFPFQLVDEVVMDAHDIRMDLVITG